MIALLLAALAAPALAGVSEPNDGIDPRAVRDAVRDEIARSAELSLPDAAPPHHVLVRGAFGWERTARSAFGALMGSEARALDDLTMEVRAGTPAFDSTVLRVDRDTAGFERSGIADVPNVRSLRETLWRDLDRGYKDAVESLGRAQALRQALEEGGPLPPSWQVLDTPTVDERLDPVPDAPDLSIVEDYARALTAGVRGRPLLDASASVFLAAGHGLVVATDGTSMLASGEASRVTVSLSIRAPDGETRELSRTWAGDGLADLPTEEEGAKAVSAMAERLERWAAAAPLDTPWVGPVILRGRAAAEVLQDVVVRSVQGTPEPARFRRWNQSVARSDPRFEPPGTRLLPGGWTVVDDATQAFGDPCCSRYDDEGTPRQRVTVVEDGVVVAHLMTRTPSEHFQQSTGHARAQWRGPAEAEPTWVTVTPARALSEPGLMAKARRDARLAGVDAVLVIEDADRAFGRFVYADGREVPVRAFTTSELDARSLRGMRFAGPSTTVEPRGTIRYTVPDLLLSNIAITADEPSSRMPEPKRTSPLWAKTIP